MLTDYWVISLFLIQTCSIALLFGALSFSTKIIKKWSKTSNSEIQIYLERRSYLVSSIIQFVLFFQLVSLVIFLHTSNNHLPQIIKGAMCATGALDVNDFGYPALFIKSGAVFLYVIFLILNYFDNSEPNYPLTPVKYWLVFPIFFFITLDSYTLFQYFSQIEPDIIATCCSVSFLGGKASYFDLSYSGNAIENYLYSFFILGTVLVFLQILSFFIKKKFAISILQTLLSVVFVYFAIYTLKYFFVKYIYGLPSHNCLFDIFWSKYNYVGYVIFGAYYGLLITTVLQNIYYFYQSKLQYKHHKFLRNVRFLFLCFLGISLILPSLYWYFWNGNL